MANIAHEIIGPSDAPLTILYSHGHLSSTRELALLPDFGKRFQIIAYDRHGMGDTPYERFSSLANRASIIKGFVDKLGLQAYIAFGYSGGFLDSLALASVDPRVQAVIGVSAFGDINDPGVRRKMTSIKHLYFTTHVPLVKRFFLFYHKRELARNSPALFQDMCEADKEVVQDPHIRSLILAAQKASFKHGIAGNLQEAELFARPWLINFKAISASVALFYGSDDETTPPEMGKAFRTLTNLRLKIFPGEGHFVGLTKSDQILADVEKVAESRGFKI